MRAHSVFGLTSYFDSAADKLELVKYDNLRLEVGFGTALTTTNRSRRVRQLVRGTKTFF